MTDLDLHGASPVVVGISGASGAAIGVRVVERLIEAGVPVELVVSGAGRRTLGLEVGPGAVERLTALGAQLRPLEDIGAAIASGSFLTRGMIVAPCSMRTLAAIAHGLGDTLLTRAADVQLKERRPLVLIARETPLHLGHLRAMVAATEMGAVIMPPVPAFYLAPQGTAEIVDQIAARAIGLLGLDLPQGFVWRG